MNRLDKVGVKRGLTVPITIVGIHIGQGWLAGKHGRRGIQVTFNHGWRSGRASNHSIISSDRIRYIRGMRTAAGAALYMDVQESVTNSAAKTNAVCPERLHSFQNLT